MSSHSVGEPFQPIQREDPPRGYKVQSPDTEYWAEKLIFERYRQMTLREKAAMLTDMCRCVEQLTMAGLRQRHPDLGRAGLELKAAALRIGRERVLEITGVDPEMLGPETLGPEALEAVAPDVR